MADRPRDDTWWIASDGKWYPPTLQPDHVSPDHLSAGQVAGRSVGGSSASTDVPRILTRAVAASLGATSVAFGAAAFFGLRFAAALRSGTMSATELDTVELASLGWSSVGLLGMIVTGVMVIVWTFLVSRAMDARRATGRRWRGGWTIGSWFVPLANIVLPRLVFNEIERIAKTTYTGAPLGGLWKGESRSHVGDLWWLLWISGLITLQSTQFMLTDTAVDDGTLAVLSSVSSIGYMLLAGAGISLFFVVRRVEISSREVPRSVL